MPGKTGKTRKTKNHRDMRQTVMENTKTKPKDDQDSKFKPGQSLTPEQQAIASRVMAETAEWDQIGEESMNDFSLQITPLDLKHNFPEAWRDQQEKRYAYRFC